MHENLHILFPEFNNRQIMNIKRIMSIVNKNRKSYCKARWKKKFKRLMDIKYGLGMKISH